MGRMALPSNKKNKMPSREQNGGDPDSLLPRGFPTIDDLAECETSEEKEEICDKADLLVERLEAKADSAEDLALVAHGNETACNIDARVHVPDWWDTRWLESSLG